MQDANDTVINPASSYSLGGVVSGSQPNTNLWESCLSGCLDYCDQHSSSKSFNIFTFEESGYNNCEVTCECRASTRFYDASDYKVCPNSPSTDYCLGLTNSLSTHNIQVRYGHPRTRMRITSMTLVPLIPMQSNLTHASGRLLIYRASSGILYRDRITTGSPISLSTTSAISSIAA